jgi:hypothetical protein
MRRDGAWRLNQAIPLAHRSDALACVEASDDKDYPGVIYMNTFMAFPVFPPVSILVVIHFLRLIFPYWYILHLFLQGHSPPVPQYAYKNTNRRTYTLTDAIRRELYECCTQNCPKHLAVFRVPCGRPMSFYYENGVMEDYVELLDGAIVGLVVNEGARFERALARGRVHGFRRPDSDDAAPGGAPGGASGALGVA